MKTVNRLLFVITLSFINIVNGFSQIETEVSRYFFSSQELIDTIMDVYKEDYNPYRSYVDIYQMYDTVFFISKDYFLDTTIVIAHTYSETEGEGKQYLCLRYDTVLYAEYENLKQETGTKQLKRKFYNHFFYRIHIYESDKPRLKVQEGDIVIMLTSHYISKYQALTFYINDEGEFVLRHIYPNYH